MRSLSFREMCMLSKPIASVYVILTYMSHKNPPNVGKYTIHAGMGNGSMVGASIMIGESDPVQVGVERCRTSHRLWWEVEMFQELLGSGFKYVVFSPLFGEMIQID